MVPGTMTQIPLQPGDLARVAKTLHFKPFQFARQPLIYRRFSRRTPPRATHSFRECADGTTEVCVSSSLGEETAFLDLTTSAYSSTNAELHDLIQRASTPGHAIFIALRELDRSLSFRAYIDHIDRTAGNDATLLVKDRGRWWRP